MYREEPASRHLLSALAGSFSFPFPSARSSAPFTVRVFASLRVPGPGTFTVSFAVPFLLFFFTLPKLNERSASTATPDETKRTLKRKGKAKVTAKVTYTPDGGNPNIVANTDTQTVKLIKHRRE